jgi:hypothetical protein
VTCEENGETLSLALAGGYDKDMEPNPYLTPQTADALKRKRRRIDLFDVFAYGLCAWFALDILGFGAITLYFMTGYGFGD